MATVKPRMKGKMLKGRKKRSARCGPSVLASNACPKTKIPQEVEFLRAVESGDYPSVRRMLHDDPGLNVNCTDLMGRTPLRIAVQNESEEIVELLLDRAGMRNMYESLLQAISLDHDQIAMIILRHPLYTKLERETRLYSNGNICLATGNDDSLFAAETTPLILAAQRNRYEVVSLLLKRGAKIEEPHDNSCDCTRCDNMRDSDEFRYARSRLDAYRGLSSEAYISLSSSDPILCAFNTRQRLFRVAAGEKHYKGEYNLLRAKLSTYVVNLLNSVRGNEELDTILNEGADNEDEVLARLQLAIRYNEKKFVAHCACQKKLTTIWYGTMQHYFNRYPAWVHPLVLIAISLAFPFLALFYLVGPATKVGTLLRTPLVKFLGQTISFFVFLSLIITFSFTCAPSRPANISPVVYTKDYIRYLKSNLTAAGIGYSTHVRVFEPTNVQIALQVFVVGMLWQECKQLYSSSYKYYLRSVFNILDSLSLSIYTASFSLRYISNYKTRVSLIYFSQWSGVEALLRNEDEATYRYYWLFADRYYWDTVDPLVVSEGLFAVANVLSFSRLFYILAANEQLGPLQVSIGRMLTDVFKFSMIFLIVFVAFLVGLNNLYWYYNPSVRDPVEMTRFHEIADTQAEKAFGTFENTLKTVYWALFGMGDSDVVELGSGYKGGFTQRVGYVVYGAYNFTAVIVLLNMLIAMMAQSFETIQAQADIEWKFSRSVLYMEFIQPGPTLPVPFNIIPSPKAIYELCVSLSSCVRRRPSKPDAADDHVVPNALNKGTKVKGDESGSEAAVRKIKNVGKKLYCNRKQDSGSQSQERTPYEVIMKRIVKRYIFESQQVDTSPLEGDIDELKQDLSSVRFELSNALENQKDTIVKSVNYISAKLDLYISLQNPTCIDTPYPGKGRNRCPRPFVMRGRKNKVQEKFGHLRRKSSVFGPESFYAKRAIPSTCPSEHRSVEGDEVEEEIVAHHILYDNTVQQQSSSGEVRAAPTDHHPGTDSPRQEVHETVKHNGCGVSTGGGLETLREIDVDSMSVRDIHYPNTSGESWTSDNSEVGSLPDDCCQEGSVLHDHRPHYDKQDVLRFVDLLDRSSGGPTLVANDGGLDTHGDTVNGSRSLSDDMIPSRTHETAVTDNNPSQLFDEVGQGPVNVTNTNFVEDPNNPNCESDVYPKSNVITLLGAGSQRLDQIALAILEEEDDVVEVAYTTRVSADREEETNYQLRTSTPERLHIQMPSHARSTTNDGSLDWPRK